MKKPKEMSAVFDICCKLQILQSAFSKLLNPILISIIHRGRLTFTVTQWQGKLRHCVSGKPSVYMCHMVIKNKVYHISVQFCNQTYADPSEEFLKYREWSLELSHKHYNNAVKSAKSSNGSSSVRNNFLCCFETTNRIINRIIKRKDHRPKSLWGFRVHPYC